MALEDRILVELHRAAALAGRPGVVVPSVDLIRLARSRGSPRDALARLIHAGRVVPVRRDLHVLPDSTGRVTVGIPELVGVAAPTPHLITGGRALEENRLTDQHFFSVIVLVTSSVAGFAFRGEKAFFLTTTPDRIWGWREEGPRFAVPERAIVDAVAHSRYGVPFGTAIGALRRAQDRNTAFPDHLVEVVSRYQSAAVARRIGILVDRLFGGESAAAFRTMIGPSRTPVLLRAGGPREGTIDKVWRVVVNASIDPEEAA